VSRESRHGTQGATQGACATNPATAMPAYSRPITRKSTLFSQSPQPHPAFRLKQSYSDL